MHAASMWCACMCQQTATCPTPELSRAHTEGSTLTAKAARDLWTLLGSAPPRVQAHELMIDTIPIARYIQTKVVGNGGDLQLDPVCPQGIRPADQDLHQPSFGRSILDVYTSHLGPQCAEPAVFKPQVEFVGTFDDIDVLNAIPMGDIWDDASLLGPLKYLMTSSKVRWGGDASICG